MNNSESPSPAVSQQRAPLGAQMLTACIIMIVIGALTWQRGVQSSPDVGTYSHWGDALLRARFNFPQMLSETHSVFPPTLYVGFVTVVAICKLLLGDSWMAGVVILNLLSLGAIGALVLRLSWQLSGNRLAAWSAPILVLVGSDLWTWARYPLSDLTFVALSTLILVRLCELVFSAAHQEDRKIRINIIALIILLVIATFYRPTGILLCPPALFAFWLSHRVSAPRPTPATAAPHPAKMTLMLVMLSIFVVVLHAHWMLRPTTWPLRAFSSTMQFNAAHYRMGEVVFDRPDTWRAPPTEVWEFVEITLDRWRWFWAFTYHDFSWRHNLSNALFFVPVYGFALWTLFTLARRKIERAEICCVLWILVVSLWTVSLFHALVQVDYDWRYRLPILPTLIVLATFGIAQFASHKTFNRIAPTTH